MLPPAPPPLPSPYLLTPAHLYHTLNQAVGWSPFCLVPRPSSQIRGIHLGPLRLPPSDDYQSSLLLPAVLSYGAAQRLRRCPQARLTALISPKADIALHWSSVWRDANPAQTRGVAPDGHSMLTGHLSTTRSYWIRRVAERRQKQALRALLIVDGRLLTWALLTVCMSSSSLCACACVLSVCISRPADAVAPSTTTQCASVGRRVRWHRARPHPSTIPTFTSIPTNPLPHLICRWRLRLRSR